MKNDFEDLIDRYIKYEMNAEERKAFEQILENDPELKEKFLAMYFLMESETITKESDISDVLARMNYDEINTMMNKNVQVTTNYYHSAAPRSSVKLFPILAVAATIIIAIFFIFKNDNYKYDTSEIYATHFREAPVVEYSRSGNNLSEKDIEINKAIISYYQKKEYKNVAQSYNTHWQEKNIDQIPENSLIPIAYSLIEVKEEKNAIQFLSSIIKHNPDVSEEAEWLLLGAYLKKGDRKKAERISFNISQNEGIYSQKAKDIYTKLKED